MSRIIQIGTGSRWSHVGIVVRTDVEDELRLWESTTLSALKDLTVFRRVAGVQSHYFSDVLRTYSGTVAVRRLRKPLTDWQRVKMARTRHHLNGRPYQKDKIKMACKTLGLPFCPRGEDLSSVFCSELVAECHQATGHISHTLPSNTWSPKTFADRELPWLLKRVETLR